MKIATWNVNGIRARASQLQDWMESERPDVVCLQELKAELSQVPEVVLRQEYHAFWHCCKGYSGVSLQIRKDAVRADPVYGHPPFDLESRVVTADLGDSIIASMYVPNGGKDYPSKISFLRRTIEWAREIRAGGRCSRSCWTPGSPMWAGPWSPTTTACSPGGLPGGIFGPGTSGGGWTTCWHHPASSAGREVHSSIR